MGCYDATRLSVIYSELVVIYLLEVQTAESGIDFDRFPPDIDLS